jgi:hypothetical protein
VKGIGAAFVVIMSSAKAAFADAMTVAALAQASKRVIRLKDD